MANNSNETNKQTDAKAESQPLSNKQMANTSESQPSTANQAADTSNGQPATNNNKQQPPLTKMGCVWKMLAGLFAMAASFGVFVMCAYSHARGSWRYWDKVPYTFLFFAVGLVGFFGGLTSLIKLCKKPANRDTSAPDPSCDDDATNSANKTSNAKNTKRTTPDPSCDDETNGSAKTLNTDNAKTEEPTQDTDDAKNNSANPSRDDGAKDNKN